MTTPFKITVAYQGKKKVVSAHLSLTVGRSKANDIQLLDPKVSRFHCKIEHTGQGIILFDLLSKNGSYVNGVKRDTTQLDKGDVLKIGDSIFTLTPPTTPVGGVMEKTMVTDSLPWFEPQEKRTQEFEVKKKGVLPVQASMSSKVEKLRQANVFSQGLQLVNFLEHNKTYLAATVIFCLAFIFFSTKFFTDTHQQTNPQRVASIHSSTQTTTPRVEKPTASPEDRENATRIAREANTILDTGGVVQAISMFSEALSYDAENILAQKGIAEAHTQVESLANICFARGQQGLKAFRYQEALTELETVLLLLKDRPYHELFMEANKLIRQAQIKVTN